MKKKSILTSFLAVTLLSTMFTACSNNNDNGSITPPSLVDITDLPTIEFEN